MNHTLLHYVIFIFSVLLVQRISISHSIWIKLSGSYSCPKVVIISTSNFLCVHFFLHNCKIEGIFSVALSTRHRLMMKTSKSDAAILLTKLIIRYVFFSNRLSSPVRRRLFRTHCSRCELWSLTNKQLEQQCSTWRKSLRSVRIVSCWP